jgi:hypothetical protein
MEASQKFYSQTKYYSKPALLVGVIGLIGSIIGFVINQQHFFHSYLIAYVFWASIMLGALFFTMLHHVSGAVWSTVLRRILENLMNSVPLMAIFFIPIIFGMHDLYHWTHEEALAGDALLQKKAPYLNTPFFIIRTAVYFLIWYLLSKTLFRNSLRQDDHFEVTQIKKMRRISAPGIVLFAITITFAAFDWLMSLDPHWYSTIFGLYIFAGSFLSVLAFLVILAASLRKKNVLTDVITIEHYHDLGKFLFGFTIFWGYMAFSQYFLIWYANIPEETIWFRHRWEGSWKYITMLLVFGHFLLPFLMLMPRAVKRNITALSILSFWILLMHYFDLYWLVMPGLYEHGFHISWIDFFTFLGIGGIFLWYFWSRYLGAPLVPINDPHLKDSIKFLN